MQLKKEKDTWDIDYCHGKVYVNQKFLRLCKALQIDLHNLCEFRNPRKYARYYKSIIQEPEHGAFTYRLWKNSFVSWYDNDISCNELSSNEMVFQDSVSLRDNWGTGIWYSLALAEQLKKQDGNEFLIQLSYYDKGDIHSFFQDSGECEDLVRVSFCRIHDSFEESSFIEQLSNKNSPIGMMIIDVSHP